MNTRRRDVGSPLGDSLLSLADAATATRRKATKTDAHSVRGVSRIPAAPEAVLAPGIATFFCAPQSAEFPKAFEQAAAAGRDPHSRGARGPIGLSRGGRTASIIHGNGAVSAEDCIRQTCRSEAQTGHAAQTTSNRPPARTHGPGGGRPRVSNGTGAASTVL